MVHLSFCPCCISQSFAYFTVTAMILYQTVYTLFKCLKPKNKVLKFLFTFSFWMFSIAMGLFAIFLGILSIRSDYREQFFTQLCIQLSSKTELDSLRCSLLKNIEGNILELGPGPGTNFRCLKENSKITKWVGVEPNIYFQTALQKEKDKHNISFPVSTVWLKGENLDVEVESFDYVIATHVLCSVDEVEQVLQQVARALKPGGSYLFLEHVQADRGSLLYYFQKVIEPIITITANGCHFKETWKILTSDFTPSFRNFQITMDKINAPVGLPFMVPHIMGRATKPSSSAVVL